MYFDVFEKDLRERIAKKKVKMMVIMIIEWLLGALKWSVVDMKNEICLKCTLRVVSCENDFSRKVWLERKIEREIKIEKEV